MGKDYKYKLEYYLNLARKLVEAGTHVLSVRTTYLSAKLWHSYWRLRVQVKDMAGLLTPQSAKLLIGALRREFPDMPIHVHTHDTAGTGVASMKAVGEKALMSLSLI